MTIFMNTVFGGMRFSCVKLNIFFHADYGDAECDWVIGGGYSPSKVDGKARGRVFRPPPGPDQRIGSESPAKNLNFNLDTFY